MSTRSNTGSRLASSDEAALPNLFPYIPTYNPSAYTRHLSQADASSSHDDASTAASDDIASRCAPTRILLAQKALQRDEGGKKRARDVWEDAALDGIEEFRDVNGKLRRRRKDAAVSKFERASVAGEGDEEALANTTLAPSVASIRATTSDTCRDQLCSTSGQLSTSTSAIPSAFRFAKHSEELSVYVSREPRPEMNLLRHAVQTSLLHTRPSRVLMERTQADTASSHESYSTILTFDIYSLPHLRRTGHTPTLDQPAAPEDGEDAPFGPDSARRRMPLFLSSQHTYKSQTMEVRASQTLGCLFDGIVCRTRDVPDMATRVTVQEGSSTSCGAPGTGAIGSTDSRSIGNMQARSTGNKMTSSMACMVGNTIFGLAGESFDESYAQ
ncbi:hypothetical protein IE81DRAFT_321947 [Ceraceosorus guamensis]|uniref:Uncharacterized protein n=1 Tax=Ceraceosorus guamensis TaxID=1522189 RepID=A0A316W2R0_9BASI|nr:hypothetical protein IE81DRAFT_321947 [Ceraceosorus guamensis]PWN43784.1 hypothetical protein IE81DRAFT_321947 [Ceraceosorus guamensis]